jgi:hypothetical protein
MTTEAGEARPATTATATTRPLVLLLRRHIAIPIYLLLSSIAVMSWYAGAKLAWGDDATHPLALSRISTYFHLLGPDLGGPDGRKFPFLLPLGGLLELWRVLHLPYDLTVVQPIVVVLILAGSASSMYVLVRVILPSLPRLAAFGAGLFYAFNLYTTVTIWSSMAYLAIHYALLPLVVVAWVAALRRATVSAGVAAGLAWALALTPAYITTPVAVTDTTLFVTLGLALVARSPGARVRTFMTGATTYAVWLALSLFWLIPLVISTSSVSASGSVAGDPTVLFGENSARLLDALRLGGYWGITSTYVGYPYFAWARYYSTIGLAAGTVVPVLAACGVVALIYGRRNGGRGTLFAFATHERQALAFSLGVTVAALFLITGTHAPLGSFKSWAVSELNLNGPFRSVYQRFGVYLALGYSPLIATGLGAIQALTGRIVGLKVAGYVAVSAATVAVAVVPAWPMWTGKLMDSSGYAPARRVTVPNDYYRVAKIINQTPGDFDVLTLPFGGLGITSLHWDTTNLGFYDRGVSRGYKGLEPLALMTGKGILTSDGTAPYIFDWAKAVVKGRRSDISRALELLNARYVVLHLDENIPYLQGSGKWTGLAIRKVGGRLDRLPNLRLVFASYTLRVYAVLNWHPFRVFALAHGGPGTVDALTGRLRPLRYQEHGYGRYAVDSSQLRKNEVLVVNRPYDARWRANGRPPIRVAPGLTGFEPSRTTSLAVSFPPEHRVRTSLLLLPVTLALAVLALLATVLLRRSPPWLRDRRAHG